MRIHRETLERSTRPDTDIHDLSDEVGEITRRSGIREGLVLVFTPGSTAGVTVIEFESGAMADLKAAIDRLAPADGDYAHNARWGDGNGYSHVRAARPTFTTGCAEPGSRSSCATSTTAYGSARWSSR